MRLFTPDTDRFIYYGFMLITFSNVNALAALPTVFCTASHAD